MTHVHLSKVLQALTIAAALAALTATTVALAGTTRASKNATPDWFQRYASAHPYGKSITSDNSTPDWFERYASAHPYGKSITSINSTLAHTPTALTDLRSPDTRNVADTKQPTPADKRSPDTIDATNSRTALAATIIPPTNIGQQSNFDWRDASIGATAAILILGLLAALTLLLPLRPHRRQPPQTT